MATIRDILTLAFQHFQAGRLLAAEQLCRQVLHVQPDHVDACHLLGLVAHQTGRHQEATEWIGRSIRAHPDVAAFHGNLGLCYQALGHWQDAEACYHRALQLDPNQARTHACLGAVLCEQGKVDEAIASLRRALELQPNEAEVHNCLGLALKRQGKVKDAAACYWRAVQLRPDFAQAHNNLGNVMGELGMLAQSVTCYRAAVERDPKFAEAHYNLGQVLKQLGKVDDAVASLRRAVELKPDFAESHLSLAAALQEQGHVEEAGVCYRRVLEMKPDSALARHMAAACTRVDAPPRAGDAYIKDTFDAIAPTFDEQLARLNYCGPQLIAAATDSLRLAPAEREVLDAGCGTGLCGPVLRPLARQLTGLDLSSGMLERAGARKLYDRLVQGELTEYLQSVADAYDLIASADTLIYFGDLRPVLAAAAAALRPGGFLIFTVEKAAEDSASQGYVLQSNGRYSHTEDYVRKNVTDAGLTLREVSAADVRIERGQPVHGFVVIAERCRPLDAD